MPKVAKVSLVVVAVVLVVFAAGSYMLDRYLLGKTYARSPDRDSPFMLTDADVAAEYRYDDVEFELDGNTLRGHVYRADGERGLVVFRHGIFSHHQDYLALITALVDKGWSVFAYDAIGCGDSDGGSVIGFAQSPLDVREAVRFADETGMAENLPIVLFGHSWGGYGVAGALDFEDVRDRVSACVSLSGFDTPDDIIFESSEGSMGALAVTQRPFIDLIGFLDFGDDASRSAARAIDRSGLPVLVVHGTGDMVISYDNASIIAERDNITNPLVRYRTESEPGRDGHNSYFYSPASQRYLEECADRYAALLDEYAGEVPADVLDEFEASVDKRKANTADPDLIGEIDAFFAEAIR